MTINKNDEMIRINVEEAIAQSKPVLVFDNVTPIKVEDARNYYQKSIEFFINRIERAAHRPTPELYDANGAMSMGMKKFQDDVNALLHTQKCRAAIETVMATGNKVSFTYGEDLHTMTFEKINEKSILIKTK